MSEFCVPEIAWCVMCRGPRLVRAIPIAQAFRERAGLVGTTLECTRCETALLTVYQRAADAAPISAEAKPCA